MNEDEKKIKIGLIVDESLNGFGAYFTTENPDVDSKAIVLSLRNIAGWAKLDGKDFETLLKEVVAHELMHAIQEAFGQMFSETAIHKAMSDPAELIVCESDLQKDEAMQNREYELLCAVTELRDALEKQGGVCPEHLTERAVKDALNRATEQAIETAKAQEAA